MMTTFKILKQLKTLVFIILFTAIAQANQLTNSLKGFPEIEPRSIDERSIEITKTQISIHPSESQGQFQYTALHSYNSSQNKKYKEIIAYGDFGVLRMYRKNKSLLVYESGMLRISCPKHRLEPQHKNKNTLQVQLIYSLTFGGQSDHQNLGLSYFITTDQSISNNQNSQFVQTIIRNLDTEARKNNSRPAERNPVKLQNYFSAPKFKNPENLYLYKTKESGRVNSPGKQWLWVIRRKSMSLVKGQFEKLRDLLVIQNSQKGQCDQIKADQRNFKVWVGKLKPMKGNTQKKVQEESKEESCKSDQIDTEEL